MAKKKVTDKELDLTGVLSRREKEKLGDPIEILSMLKDAILNKEYDKEAVSVALRQLLQNYEAKSRVFLIAAANAELPRVIKLLSFLNSCEDEMFTDHRVKNASTRELIKLYALAQSTLVTGLDNVKKVADMRIEIMRASGGSDGLDSMFSGESNDMNALSDLPGLDARSRDKVRKVINGLMDSIDQDSSLDESDTDSDD